MSSEKIRPEHLARTAFVYVRQSTLGQVRDHHESRRRQYELADHARRLGWSDVVVIDEDLGKSGATAVGRPGFQRLVADVSLGRAGAVLGLEVSRLARNNRDWYQLLDLCALMATLIIDADGVYDPRHLNDRLLLGLKGTMSEAELGWLRQRAWEALLAKARRGELRLGLPPQLGQKPRPLQEKGRRWSRPHPSQRRRAKPWSRIPHVRKSRNSSSTNRGRPAPSVRSAASRRNASRCVRTTVWRAALRCAWAVADSGRCHLSAASGSAQR